MPKDTLFNRGAYDVLVLVNDLLAARMYLRRIAHEVGTNHKAALQMVEGALSVIGVGHWQHEEARDGRDK